MAKSARIKNFYKLSQIEYNKYKNSKDKDLEGSDHLAEAGEKLWNVYNMLCEYITKQKIRNEKQLRNELTKYSNKTGDYKLASMYRNAYELHIYFYRGHANTEFEEEIFNELNMELGKLISRFVY